MKIIHKRLAALLRTYLAKKPVSFIYLFGSVAKGTADSMSDLDLAVAFQKNFSNKKEDSIIDEIASFLATELHIPFEKIDIKIFSELPLRIRFRVIRDGQLVYLKDIAHQREEVIATMKLYHDEKPFFDLAQKAFLKRYAKKQL